MSKQFFILKALKKPFTVFSAMGVFVMWFLNFIIIFLFLSGCNNPPEDKGKLAQAIYITPQTYVEKAVFYGIVQARQSSPLVVQTEGVLDWLAQPGDELLKST